ncbi:probable WRKY transcription factor 32 isoform X2 [Neltuma alba]|uniref:probable WRKY transcription factor 32 isoform X2 n=1 Tax=Neltuma alba TaxID=207710 RepID=UPI0010A44CD5|nr:probable WRKY transcription factor 32 isoform X2 [Prosopis alba]
MPLQSHASDPIKRLSSLFRTIPYAAMPEHHALRPPPIRTLDRPAQPEDKRDGRDKNEGQHDDDDDDDEEKKHRERVCEEPSSELRNCKPTDEEAEPQESASETLATPSSVETVVASKSADLQASSSTRIDGRDESKEPNGPSKMEIIVRETVQGACNQTEDRLAVSVYPTPLSVLSPSFVTQPLSSVPSSTVSEQIPSPQNANNGHTPGTGKKNSSGGKALSAVNVARASASDGYNWRKYGQKQVKSPTGFRSYYRCTHSGCSAKKIEFCDQSGHMIEIIYKGQHSHEPLRKTNTTGEIKFMPSREPTVEANLPEQTIGGLKDADPTSSTKESLQHLPCSADKKRQNSSGLSENGKVILKVEHVDEPELKRRVKNGDLTNLDSHVGPGKKSKFVVHAAGDVGISGDGYRWRKYGQKMVRGNSHPRNYYRCTSAGCPVRKQIETAVDDPTAVIITYKGAHNHDQPVPRKRQGPPSAPLVATIAPASSNNLDLKSTDSLQNQENSAQWSEDSEEELTEDASDLGGEKAIESARTLLSMGEIKPC